MLRRFPYMDYERRGRRGGSRTAPPTNSAGGRRLVAADYGVAWVTHGLMVPYIGFFGSIPRGWPRFSRTRCVHGCLDVAQQ
jgi:hypothetical protein